MSVVTPIVQYPEDTILLYENSLHYMPKGSLITARPALNVTESILAVSRRIEVTLYQSVSWFVRSVFFFELFGPLGVTPAM